MLDILRPVLVLCPIRFKKLIISKYKHTVYLDSIECTSSYLRNGLPPYQFPMYAVDCIPLWAVHLCYSICFELARLDWQSGVIRDESITSLLSIEPDFPILIDFHSVDPRRFHPAFPSRSQFLISTILDFRSVSLCGFGAAVRVGVGCVRR